MAGTARTGSAATTRQRLRRIVAILDEAFPDARLELDYATPLDLLVALILAARSPDVFVNELTAPLFRRFRTAADWANAAPGAIEEPLKRLNAGRIKAAGIRAATREIVDRFGGKVPENLDDLVSLPRVGRKTANVLLGNAFGHDVIGVDTHVARLSQRLGLTDEHEPDEIEAALMDVVPKGQRVHFTHLMQLHGRRTCVAKKPKCPECPVRELCPYPDKTPEEGVRSSVGRRAAAPDARTRKAASPAARRNRRE